MLKILVADDHPIVRQGVMRIIEKTGDMVVAGEAGTGQEVLDKVRKNDYDLVLLDISMPDRDGMDIMAELKVRKPQLPVLVLTMHPERNYAIRMFRLGASGYLNKERAPYELVQAIRDIIQGRKYVSSDFAEVLTFDARGEVGRPIHETLSNREFQIMCMIASGKKIREIAKDLSLSIKTVNTHRYHILAKMKMKNNAEIIHYAIENKLIGA